MQRQGFFKLITRVKWRSDGHLKKTVPCFRLFTSTPGIYHPRGTRFSGPVDRGSIEIDKGGHETSDTTSTVRPPPKSNIQNMISGERSNVKELLDESLSDETKSIKPEFPSDVELVRDFQNYNDWVRDQKRHAYKPEITPKETSIVLFPGQGSQFVGMSKRLLVFPNVKEMFEVANEILKYDLLDICLNGPKSELDKTLNCQPAIFVTSLAAIEAMREENPKAIENCIGSAGFSIGEYAALVFVGSMTFEDGLKVVKVRAKAMQKASEAEPSGMMTVFLGPDNKCSFACHTARLYCQKKLGMEDPVCEIANYLYPECKVIAGHVQALEFLEKHGKDFGIRRLKKLPVSGAFHTKLMKPACLPVEQVIKPLKLRRPLVPIYSNVTARQMSISGQIKRLLVEQIKSPVKWEQLMQTISARPKGEDFPYFYEVGPGKQLGALLKMTNAKAYSQYQPIIV